MSATITRTYPVQGWIDAPEVADVPAAFRAEVESEYLQYVEAERARFADWSGNADEWNARGEKSAHRGMAGSVGAWHGARQIVASLVSDELARFWTEVSARLTLTDYAAHVWAERERATIARFDRAERDLNVNHPGYPVGTVASDGVLLLRMAVDGWQVLTRPDGVTPVEADELQGDIALTVESMRASGMFTDTMLQRVQDAYLDGVTRRNGRVVVAPGDLAGAMVYAVGSVSESSRRGKAIAAAIAAFEPTVVDLSAPF